MSARWKYQAGEYGNTVTVYEPRSASRKVTNLYVRIRQKETGKQLRRSLGHSNRQKAMTYADQIAKQLLNGAPLKAPEVLTWARLFTQYQRYKTPNKSKRGQQEDGRRIEMWLRLLGGSRNPAELGFRVLESFIRDRSAGRIDPRGNRVANPVREVRTRTIQADLEFLNIVLNWGTSWREGGEYLLNANPMRGFRIPAEKNPRRPVVTHDRLLRLREVADELQVEITWNGRREKHSTYFLDLLDLADSTGRRITAICSLHSRDIRSDVRDYGAIVWPASTDKIGLESTVPMTAELRKIIDRCIDRVGAEGYLFPAPRDRTRPMSKELAAKWLRTGEVLASLPKQDGTAWHGFRRKFINERKHLPDHDVAFAAGFSDVNTIQTVYQQPDEETLLRVLSEPRRLLMRKVDNSTASYC